MSRVRNLLLAAALAVCGAGAVMAETLPTGWASYVGSAGINTTADGVVTLAPGFADYQWISTANSSGSGGTLPTGSVGTSNAAESNGSSARTSTFAASAGDKLNFYFNFITSDGNDFTDYAWAALYSGPSTFDSYLFTARTSPTGNTVPGKDLPGLGSGVTLTPPSTAITPGAPGFFPLDKSSGACFAAGCGYTGWIQMSYMFVADGTYSLAFGVTNWGVNGDTAFDSALAVAGITIEKPVADGGGNVPEPGTLALAGIAMVGLAAVRRRRSR